MGNITIQGDLTGGVPGGEVGGGNNLTTVGAIPYVSAPGVLNQDATKLFWDATNKRLGVGTGSPASTLEVGATAGPSLRVSTSSSVFVQTNQSQLTIGTGNTGYPLIFRTEATEAARVMQTTQNFLIGGTTDGNYKLDVQKSGSTGTFRVYDQTATTGSTLAVIQAGAGQSGNLLETKTSAGVTVNSMSNAGLGIGTSTNPGLIVVTSATGQFMYADPGTNSIRTNSVGMFSWANVSNASGTIDLSLSRASAGVVQVGDGGANANGQINAIRSVLTDTAASGNVLTVYNNNASNPGEHIRLGYNDSYRWSLSRSISSGNLTFRYQNVALNANLNSVMELAESGTLSLYNQTATTGFTKAVIRAGAGQSTTNLTEWQNNAGTVLVGVDSTGGIATTSFMRIGAASYVGWLGRVSIYSPATGVLTLYNGAENDFSRLQFGGTTSSFPALKRSSAILQARLADDSANTQIQASRFISDQTTPSASTDAGTAGAIWADANYIYVQTAAGTIKRVALTTF